MEQSANASAERKSALESLDREELIRKCKGLLGIAQKAKKAKDELATEVANLKEKLTECDTQKHADKECLKTMQVMVDSLTQDKLNAANKIADCEKSVKSLQLQLGTCNEKLATLAALEIENEAKQKQIQRLTDENEEQEMDLKRLDEKLAKVSELSQRQTQELLRLEQSVDRWKAMETAYNKLQQENKLLQSKLATESDAEPTIAMSKHEDLVKSIESERDTNRKQYEETEVQLNALKEELEQLKSSQAIKAEDDDEKIDVLKEKLQHENEQLQKQCDEQTHKLAKYKAKICEFSSKLKEVKQSKKLLADTVFEYSKSVSKWQVQISHASKLLIKEVDQLNHANAEWEKKSKESDEVVAELKATVSELQSRLEEAAKSNENDEYRKKYEALLVEYKSLEIEIEQKNTNFDSLNDEKTKLEEQLEGNEKLIKDLRSTVDGLEVRLQESSDRNETNDIKEKYEMLHTEYKQLEKELQEKNVEISSLAEEFQQISTSLRQENEKHCNEIQNLTEECAGKAQQIVKLQENEAAANEKNTNLNSLSEEKARLEEQLEGNEKLIKDLKATVDDLEVRLQEAADRNEITDIKEKHELLNIEYKQLEKELQEKNVEISSLAEEFQQISTSLRQENEKHCNEIQNLTEECAGKAQQIVKLQENEAGANKKNAELLAEMRELNDVLKTRGEVISTQTADLDSCKAKLSEQSKQMHAIEEQLKEKTKQLDQLRNQFDNQSEILSTSTISRADDVARMRDIEDSFEEKYNKLRALALKLKKKIAEQQAIIVRLEAAPPTQTVAKGTTDEQMTKSSASPAQAQNLISLQKENDRLLDQIDSMKSQQKQLKTEINELKQQIQKANEETKSLRIVNDDIKATADANLKIKSALDEKIRAGEKQIEALKADNKNTVQQLKNAENEILKIKDLVKQKESEIGEKADEVVKVKSELNKLKASMKKSSVLNLEVEAYEKSLTEVSHKHESVLKQLSETKAEIEGHQATISKLNTEIQSLTSQLELEKQNSSEYQQQNELQRIKIKENGVEISELKRIIDDHVRESNQIKIELANLQSQQSENEVEKQKFISKLKTENEQNVAKILGLEEESRELRTKLSSCEQELANVQTEFASYKVRAQAVLRQNQSKDSSSEQELKEELTILTQAKEELNRKLAHSSEQQRRLEIAVDELKGEKANLQDRCKKLLQLLDETRQQIETLQLENRMQMQEHQEALKTQRLQVDTLNNCFKTQIEEMQRKHEVEVATLKSSSSPATVAATVKKSADAADSALTLAKGAQLTTEQRIELLMMERQDGEGSECATSSTNQVRKMSSATRDKHETIPLDELLNNAVDELFTYGKHEEHDDKLVPKEKFEAQQSRVKHLSTLLSEAEMDVARLTEMNAMLKEELRRQERSTEREKQMQNLEYMKNVIFKFLTINNADERAHLVPVLNIILKLSPDESKTLQSVARGSDGSQSGWSNILPMW